MEILGIVSIPAITVICYLIGEAVKAAKVNDRWIPVIVGVCGAILGVVSMYTMTDFPADNIILAIAYGIVSGLASTGVHQIYKQLTKPVENGAQEGYNDR